MANSVLTPSILAREALMILDNNLVFGNLIYRAYEGEFANTVNGYKIGSTLSIRKPARFTVRTGAVAASQDVVEGTTQITINKQIGVDFQFTSQELTLNMNDLRTRVIEPALVPLANQVDRDIAGLFPNVWNWTSTTLGTLNNFAKLALGPQRLDEMAVPSDSRNAVLSPADYWGMIGNFTGLYVQPVAETALKRAKLGTIANVDTYNSQNAPLLTTGTRGGAPLVNGAGQTRTYGGDPTVASNNVNGVASSGTLVKDTNQQTLVTNGWTASLANALAAGEVFTLAGVFAINPVTKQVLPYLQQFTAINQVASDGSGNSTITISPAITTSGAYQTVSAAPASGAALTPVGAASTSYTNNLVFHKNAFALCVVPLDMPQGTVGGARESYKNITVRVQPFYDGINDISKWRLDMLYGVKAIYPDLATRLSG
jgi:hypothetical protein